MAFWLTLHSPSRTSSSLFLGQDFVSLVLSLNATPPLSQSNSGGGAVICCRSSFCSAAGSTTRAAATGSTEPKRLRQLSGVAHHIANDGKMVCFREAAKTCADHFRDVTKLLLCGEHIGEVTDMAVCSACHNNLLTDFARPLSCGQRKTGSRHRWSHR